jgi:hypothetical protein
LGDTVTRPAALIAKYGSPQPWIRYSSSLASMLQSLAPGIAGLDWVSCNGSGILFEILDFDGGLTIVPFCKARSVFFVGDMAATPTFQQQKTSDKTPGALRRQSPQIPKRKTSLSYFPGVYGWDLAAALGFQPFG